MTGDFSWVLGLFSNVWGLAFVLLVLGGSIFVHELGHFLAARWRGMKVDRFSIGFGPKIFSWKGKDGVEYRVSWLPFGGYVALPQLVDMHEIEGGAASPVDDLPPPSYLDKVIVITAGVVFNLLLALVISLLLWGAGVPVMASAKSQVVGYAYKTMTELREGATAHELLSQNSPLAPKLDNTPAPAYAAGLRPGDRILAVDGKPVRDFRDLPTEIALGAGRDEHGNPRVAITYERAGVTQTVDVSPQLVSTNERAGDDMREIGLLPAESLVVESVGSRSPAMRAGLRPDDIVTAVNGQKIYSRQQLSEFVDEAAGQPLSLTIERDGKTLNLSLSAQRVPRTKPLATLTAGPGPNSARLDLLPIYPKDTTANPALPMSQALNLLVWNLDNQGAVFGGLRPGDLLLTVNGHKVSSVQAAVDAVRASPPGQPLTLSYLSKDSQSEQTLMLPLTVPLNATVTPPETMALIGVGFVDELVNDYTLPPQQFANAFNQIFGMLRSLVNPHSDIGIRHLTGPIGISRIIYQFSLADVRTALWFAFIINVNLAILNLMPIPVLDGGHLLLFTIARLRRRELPVGFISAVQGAFMLMLFGLIIYVSFNDSQRLRGDNQKERQMQDDTPYFLPGDEIKFVPPAPAAVPPTPIVPVTTN